MKNNIDKENKLYQELLDEIKTGKHDNIINLYINENGFNKNLLSYKLKKLDKQFDNKYKNSEKYKIEYLVTTYYENHEYFNELLDKLSAEELIAFEKYLNKHEEDSDIINRINCKMLKKKKENK